MRCAIADLVLALSGETLLSPVMETLIDLSFAELEGRLKPGTAPEDCQTAFTLAAAFLVLEGLEATGKGSQNLGSFSVGDFSVTHSKEAGRSYRHCAEDLMRPYLVLADFAFRGVEG